MGHKTTSFITKLVLPHFEGGSPRCILGIFLYLYLYLDICIGICICIWIFVGAGEKDRQQGSASAQIAAQILRRKLSRIYEEPPATKIT